LWEDDVALCNGITIALQDDDLTFIQCHTLSEARIILKSTIINLVILDINLPDGNGLDFLHEIKNHDRRSSVILLTANDLETDIVSGLELGADDYITKPFSLMVLRARVKSQLRRETQKISYILIDKLSFDFEHMRFYRNDQLVELSKTEQKLLRLLIENRGQILKREMLVDRIWTDGAEYVDENALSVTIKRLRSKLEEYPAEPRYIKTIYSIGYIWVLNPNE
jgi:DNA-binding response OmpR family regulator